MVDKANVNRLVGAAWLGMEAELRRKNTSAEDVINATIAIAAGGVRYACSTACGETPEQVLQNKRAVRNALEQLLLDTADDLKSM